MDSLLLQILLMVIGIFLITFLTIYFLWPAALVRFLRWAGQQANGVQVRHADHNGYKFCYFSRGKPGLQPSILMLHGFSMDKDSWLLTLSFFPRNIHVVCVDLPGHGHTTRLPAENYTTYDQVERVHQFVESTGLNRKPFHLVGISMGGMIAGVYAALYPSEICCLSLLCPIGLRYPKDTVLMKQIKEDRKKQDVPLIPLNTQQGVELIRRGLYYTHRIPEQLLKGVFDDLLPEINFFRKCFLDVFGDASLYSLQDNMSKIRAPTQVIWGKNDSYLDVSGAEVLAKGIPNVQVHLLEKCSHLIPVDRPRKSSQLLLDFHSSYMQKN